MFAPARVNPSVEDALREALAQGDAAIGTVGPILRHLLASDGNSLFNEEIVARVRGMLDHLAGQLLDAAAAGTGTRTHDHPPATVELVVSAIAAQPALLAHLHALALEFQLTERLQARLSLDPVLSPLLQALVASPDPATAASAMALLAAQARFMQTQRRMHLPLAELPADLFHAAMQLLALVPGAPAALAAAETALRDNYDEGRSRLGLLDRLVLGMGGGATVALAISHAGTALFLTAVAAGSGQRRDLTALAGHEGQLARLALALRAAGARPEAAEEQILAIHPEASLPAGLTMLTPDRAAALLAASTAGVVR